MMGLLRRLLSASAGAVLLLPSAAPAEAQAPPTAPPIVMGDAWQGFHTGVNLGGGFGGSTATNNTGFTSNSKLESSGAVGGVQGGYTWRVAPSWTLGIEGDFDRSGRLAGH
jgi:opacity protein-like surface antigen